MVVLTSINALELEECLVPLWWDGGECVFPCGLMVGDTESAMDAAIAEVAHAAHLRHHAARHTKHGERWMLIAEITADGLAIDCPVEVMNASEGD